MGQVKSVQSAVCRECTRRVALNPYTNTIKFHKQGWDPCLGAGTTKYDNVKPFYRPPGRQTPLRRPLPPKLLKIPPPKIRIKASNTPVIEPRNGAFRKLHYENWLNRWERKFEVKIPDENVSVLTHDKYVRRSTK